MFSNPLIDSGEWLLARPYLLTALVVAGIYFAVRMFDHYRAGKTRERVRGVYRFAEELLGASGWEDAVRKLRSSAGRAVGASHVEVYALERGPSGVCRPLLGRRLESIPTNLQGAASRPINAIALCLRNRATLHVPDTHNSPLFWGNHRDYLPRGVLLIPMFAGSELGGVLEVSHFHEPRKYDPAELAALQHLANQVASLLRLHEQQARKEHVWRSERLAATGEVLSGVATELRGPLEAIVALANTLQGTDRPNARAIASESLKAAAILTRYNRFSSPGEAAPLEVNSVLARAGESAREDLAAGVSLEIHATQEPIWILAPLAQFHNVTRNLILLAAASARASLQPGVSVETSCTLRRASIAIRYGALLCEENFPADDSRAQEDQPLGYSVCKGIIHALGGDIRVVSAGESACRIEIDFPAAFPADSVSREALPNLSAASLTAIVLEPDSSSQKRLVSYVSSRRHRAIPVHNATEALELLTRFRVDIVFSAMKVGSSTWTDFYDQVAGKVGTFVLMTDSFEAEARKVFPQGGGYILRKPLDVGDIEDLLRTIAESVTLPREEEPLPVA
ncbi:MAG: GAF domain-containing protein [Candidatus Solibacter usitatus]|nr:GAF domain-containing protein [Candidatus Solibacter usitatus]